MTALQIKLQRGFGLGVCLQRHLECQFDKYGHGGNEHENSFAGRQLRHDPSGHFE